MDRPFIDEPGLRKLDSLMFSYRDGASIGEGTITTVRQLTRDILISYGGHIDPAFVSLTFKHAATYYFTKGHPATEEQTEDIIAQIKTLLAGQDKSFEIRRIDIDEAIEELYHLKNSTNPEDEEDLSSMRESGQKYLGMFEVINP